MLGKLIKHEFKDTYKTFLLLYVAILFLSVVNLGFNELGDGTNGLMMIVEVLFMIAFVLCAFFLSTISLVLIVIRFYKNLLGDEGYLMHTLPVKKSSLIISKWIVAAVWTVCSIVMVILSIFILVGREVPWGKMFDFIGKVYNGYDGMMTLTIVGFLCIMISVMSQLMLIYASMAVGQIWQKHRVLGAFLSFFAINMATQTVTSQITAVFMASNAEKLNNKFEHIVATNAGFIDGLTSIGDFLTAYLSLSAILLLAFCVLYFFICNYFMTNRLNLE